MMTLRLLVGMLSCCSNRVWDLVWTVLCFTFDMTDNWYVFLKRKDLINFITV